jgi:hypothetical protein
MVIYAMYVMLFLTAVNGLLFLGLRNRYYEMKVREEYMMRILKSLKMRSRR